MLFLRSINSLGHKHSSAHVEHVFLPRMHDSNYLKPQIIITGHTDDRQTIPLRGATELALATPIKALIDV